MPITDDIKKQAQALYKAAKEDLTPEQWSRVCSAKAELRTIIERYGEEGQIALSLAAADFAAE